VTSNDNKEMKQSNIQECTTSGRVKKDLLNEAQTQKTAIQQVNNHFLLTYILII